MGGDKYAQRPAPSPESEARAFDTLNDALMPTAAVVSAIKEMQDLVGDSGYSAEALALFSGDQDTSVSVKKAVCSNWFTSPHLNNTFRAALMAGIRSETSGKKEGLCIERPQVTHLKVGHPGFQTAPVRKALKAWAHPGGRHNSSWDAEQRANHMVSMRIVNEMLLDSEAQPVIDRHTELISTVHRASQAWVSKEVEATIRQHLLSTFGPRGFHLAEEATLNMHLLEVIDSLSDQDLLNDIGEYLVSQHDHAEVEGDGAWYKALGDTLIMEATHTPQEALSPPPGTSQAPSQAPPQSVVAPTLPETEAARVQQFNARLKGLIFDDGWTDIELDPDEICEDLSYFGAELDPAILRRRDVHTWGGMARFLGVSSSPQRQSHLNAAIQAIHNGLLSAAIWRDALATESGAMEGTEAFIALRNLVKKHGYNSDVIHELAVGVTWGDAQEAFERHRNKHSPCRSSQRVQAAQDQEATHLPPPLPPKASPSSLSTPPASPSHPATGTSVPQYEHAPGAAWESTPQSHHIPEVIAKAQYSPSFAPGDRARYIPDNREIVVTEVMTSRSPPFYEIRMSDSGETRQVTADRLALLAVPPAYAHPVQHTHSTPACPHPPQPSPVGMRHTPHAPQQYQLPPPGAQQYSPAAPQVDHTSLPGKASPSPHWGRPQQSAVPIDVEEGSTCRTKGPTWKAAQAIKSQLRTFRQDQRRPISSLDPDTFQVELYTLLDSVYGSLLSTGKSWAVAVHFVLAFLHETDTEDLQRQTLRHSHHTYKVMLSTFRNLVKWHNGVWTDGGVAAEDLLGHGKTPTDLIATLLTRLLPNCTPGQALEFATTDVLSTLEAMKLPLHELTAHQHLQFHADFTEEAERVCHSGRDIEFRKILQCYTRAMPMQIRDVFTERAADTAWERYAVNNRDPTLGLESYRELVQAALYDPIRLARDNLAAQVRAAAQKQPINSRGRQRRMAPGALVAPLEVDGAEDSGTSTYAEEIAHLQEAGLLSEAHATIAMMTPRHSPQGSANTFERRTPDAPCPACGRPHPGGMKYCFQLVHKDTGNWMEGVLLSEGARMSRGAPLLSVLACRHSPMPAWCFPGGPPADQCQLAASIRTRANNGEILVYSSNTNRYKAATPALIEAYISEVAGKLTPCTDDNCVNKQTGNTVPYPKGLGNCAIWKSSQANLVDNLKQLRGTNWTPHDHQSTVAHLAMEEYERYDASHHQATGDSRAPTNDQPTMHAHSSSPAAAHSHAVSLAAGGHDAPPQNSTAPQECPFDHDRRGNRS